MFSSCFYSFQSVFPRHSRTRKKNSKPGNKYYGDILCPLQSHIYFFFFRFWNPSFLRLPFMITNKFSHFDNISHHANRLEMIKVGLKLDITRQILKKPLVYKQLYLITFSCKCQKTIYIVGLELQ